MKYDKSTIGTRIRTLRKSYRDETHPRGLNMEEFGYLIKGSPENGSGYDRGTVAAWERGDAQISLDAMIEICDFFGCELGYLLGEYDTKTRAAVDIIDQTGLTEKAIEKLQHYREAAERMPGITFKTGISTEMLINRSGLRTLIHKELFIPALISYMLEHPDFEKISDRMCAQSLILLEYLAKNDIEQSIIKEAYQKAIDSVEIHRRDDVSLLNERYKEIIKQILIDRKEEISGAMPIRFENGLYEEAYIPNMQSTFNLARSISDSTIEMNSFLNSRDLFDIVRGFTQLKQESDRGGMNHGK